MIEFSGKLVTEIRSYYEAAVRRLRLERDVVIHNRRKYGSDHYSSADSYDQIQQLLARDDRIQKSMAQKIRPTIKTEVANLFDPIPMNAIPTTPSVVSKLQARASERLFSFYFRFDQQLVYERYHTLLGAAVDRVGWLKVFWDPNRRGMGKPDVAFQYVDMLSAPFDPSARSLFEARYVCHTKLLPRFEAEGLFPTDIDGKSVGWEVANATNLHTLDAVYQSDPMRMNATLAKPELQLVQIVEVYFRPSTMFPQGAAFVLTGQSLLAAEDNLPVFPLVPYLGMNKVPGRALPDGTIRDVSAVQDDINFFTSRLKEQALMASALSIAVPRQAQLRKADLDNLDGTVLEYEAAAGKPEWMIGPGPQPGIMSALEKAEQQYMEASGYSDAQRGLSTNSQANAKLLSYQDQLSKSVLRPDQTLSSLSDVLVAKTIVQTVAQNATDGQILRLVGGNAKPVLETFRNGLFDPDVDIAIDVAAPPPQSQELLEAKAMEIMASGGFEDTPAAKRFRQVTRRYDVSNDTDPKAAHEERALREQVDMVLTGVPPVALPQDDPECHLAVHEDFSVSDEFLSLPSDTQVAFINHMAEHQAAMFEAYGMQQSAMAPPPAGAAPASSSGYAQAEGTQDNEKGAESPFSGGQSAMQATGGDSLSS